MYFLVKKSYKLPFQFITVNQHKTLTTGSFRYKKQPLLDSVESSTQRGLALSQAGRSPGDGKQVWKWTCSPSVPPSSLSSCNEEQWLYSWRDGTQVTPPPPPPPAQASLQWLCWQANRWLGWVASGLCALSVIKERREKKKKKVYGLLVSEPSTDGMSSKHPPIPNLSRVGEGVGVGSNLPFWTQPIGLGIELDWAVQFDNLAVKWAKFKRRLNIYDHIYIMLMYKRLLRWMQIFSKPHL